jgi:hypothetical protein
MSAFGGIVVRFGQYRNRTEFAPTISIHRCPFIVLIKSGGTISKIRNGIQWDRAVKWDNVTL